MQKRYKLFPALLLAAIASVPMQAGASLVGDLVACTLNRDAVAANSGPCVSATDSQVGASAAADGGDLFGGGIEPDPGLPPDGNGGESGEFEVDLTPLEGGGPILGTASTINGSYVAGVGTTAGPGDEAAQSGSAAASDVPVPGIVPLVALALVLLGLGRRAR